MSKARQKVLLCLSGGVDSSVAAALLVASKKYDVTAAYMLNYDNNQKGAESCWLPDYRDALRVAAHLGISLIKLDFTKEYKEQVLDYMFREYEAGRTPNPDVLCNTFIKFGSWLEKARDLGFDYIATGHYAGVTPLSKGGARGGYKLLRAKDANKDQTYFLHQLNQEQLRHTMFPVGKYTKPQVRSLAAKFGLPTAQKEESMGICFVGEVPMKEFLQARIKPKPGKIVSTSGKVLGTHEGLSFYTIGQRQGVMLSPPSPGEAGGAKHLDPSATPQDDKRHDTKPLFVAAKRAETNELVVAEENDQALYKKEVQLAGVHWISGQAPRFPLQSEVRLRHRQELQKAQIVQRGGAEMYVVFAKPQRAVTPGQFAVMYKGGECLGGGVVA